MFPTCLSSFNDIHRHLCHLQVNHFYVVKSRCVSYFSSNAFFFWGFVFYVRFFISKGLCMGVEHELEFRFCTFQIVGAMYPHVY